MILVIGVNKKLLSLTCKYLPVDQCVNFGTIAPNVCNLTNHEK